MSRLFAGAALSLAFCAGCAGYQGSAKDVNPGQITGENWLVVENVPEVRQTGPHDCGAAAMVAMLSYWHKPATLSDVSVGGKQERLSAGELRSFARQRGFEAFAIHGTFEDLEHELSEGRPVLVGVGKRHAEGKVLAHYQVVVGLNRRNQRVLLMDPASGYQTNTFEGFDGEWKPTGRVTLVMIPTHASD